MERGAERCYGSVGVNLCLVFIGKGVWVGQMELG